MENVNKQLLERWVAFGKAMQKAGSELPRHLITETEQAMAAAEQAQQAEPVACAVCNGTGIDVQFGDADDAIEQPCFACAAQPPAVAVPDGYALVPIEPTPQMVEAGFGRDDDNCRFWLHPAQAYRAMLAAAQKGGA